MKSPVLSLALACATLATMPAMAQERPAPIPAIASAEATPDALLRKIAQQTQVINMLQAQLRACQSGEAFNPSHPADASTAASAPQVAPFGAQQTAPAAPPRRPVGVYQQPAEPKLTCADYSMQYFSRHPAMAAVCGVTAPAQPAPAQQQPEPEAPEDTDPEAPTPSTIRLPQQP